MNSLFVITIVGTIFALALIVFRVFFAFTLKVAILCVAVFTIFFIVTLGANSVINFQHSEDSWEELSLAKIEDSIISGKIVVVTVHEDWCINCQINKYTTLHNNKFLEFANENNIILMHVDVSNKPKLANTFMKYVGLKKTPVYMIFSLSKPMGQVLDNWLTSSYLVTELQNEMEDIDIIYSA